VPLPDVPFDARNAVIPNAQGRVLDPENNRTVTGEYVVGWIKRGPSGIIGTNKPDSVETVNHMLEDLRSGTTLHPEQPNRESVVKLLESRGVQYVTYSDWLVLDTIEQEKGQAVKRPRIKFSRIEDMLNVVREHKGIPAGD